MTNYQAGDLLLVNFAFTGGGQSKLRPALVLLDTGDADVVVARVTSQPAIAGHDVALTGW
jgi:mRNA interferase MazF